MSKDLNLCQFIGRLGDAPEIRYSSDGKAVATLSLACGDDYKDKQGNKVEQTNWIRIVAFGRLAEIMGEYLTKGSQIHVSGKQVTRKWQDQNGNDKYTTEIVADQMQMLGGQQGSTSGAGAGSNVSQSNTATNSPATRSAGNSSEPPVNDFDDGSDIPS